MGLNEQKFMKSRKLQRLMTHNQKPREHIKHRGELWHCSGHPQAHIDAGSMIVSSTEGRTTSCHAAEALTGRCMP